MGFDEIVLKLREIPLFLGLYDDLYGVLRVGDKLEPFNCISQTESVGDHFANPYTASLNQIQSKTGIFSAAGIRTGYGYFFEKEVINTHRECRIGLSWGEEKNRATSFHVLHSL